MPTKKGGKPYTQFIGTAMIVNFAESVLTPLPYLCTPNVFSCPLARFRKLGSLFSSKDKVGNRFFFFTFLNISKSTVLIGLGMIGLDRDGPVVVGNGPLVVAFEGVGSPTVGVDDALIQYWHALGGLAQRITETGNGCVQVFCCIWIIPTVKRLR